MIVVDCLAHLQCRLVVVHPTTSNICVQKHCPAFLQRALTNFQTGLVVVVDEPLTHLQCDLVMVDMSALTHLQRGLVVVGVEGLAHLQRIGDLEFIHCNISC